MLSQFGGGLPRYMELVSCVPRLGSIFPVAEVHLHQAWGKCIGRQQTCWHLLRRADLRQNLHEVLIQ